MTIKEKLNTTNLNKYSKCLPEHDIYDTELKGFHIRPGKKGLMFRVFYRNEVGKQKVFTIGSYGVFTATTARIEATRVLALVAQKQDPRAEIELAKKNKIAEEAQTLKSYIEGPYTTHQNRKKAGNHTIGIIKKHFADWFDKPMNQLKRSDVEYWQAEMEQKNKAFPTTKRTYGALQTLLNHAVQKEVIDVNPLKSIKLDKPAMSENDLITSGTNRRYLEESEIEAIFKGIDLYQDHKRKQRDNSRLHGQSHLTDLNTLLFVDHVKPFVLTMFYTGFRPGDLFGLRWEHINLKFKTITKTIEKTAHHNPEPRSFPIGEEPAKILNEWWHQNGKPKTGYVFPSKTESRMSKSAMQKPWAKIRTFGKLPANLDLYTLRHNFASQLIMSGADLLTVSKLMAHTNIQTTISSYGHLKPDHARDFINQYCNKFTFSNSSSQLKSA